MALVAATVRKKEKLRFRYSDNEGRVTERHIEPVRLVHTGRRWYLVAFDLDRDDWRTFRLDRVSEPLATGLRAASRPGPDPVELVQRGVKSRFYDKGRYSVAREKGVHHFHRLIAEALGSV